jgi:prevent-host-death family protein
MFYTGGMDQISVRELNQNTSAVLAKVRHGQTLEVTDRGRPIARLVPVDESIGLLERLVAEGKAVPAETVGVPIPEPVLGDPSVNVAEKLAEAREEERW